MKTNTKNHAISAVYSRNQLLRELPRNVGLKIHSNSSRQIFSKMKRENIQQSAKCNMNANNIVRQIKQPNQWGHH